MALTPSLQVIMFSSWLKSSLGSRHPKPQALRLSRSPHFIGQGLSLQPGSQIGCRHFAHALAGAQSGASQMGRDEHILKTEQGMIAWQGFWISDVKSRAGNPAFPQSPDKRFLIDYGSASDVNEECVPPHQA
jgi:hypothetical protein